MFDPATLPKRSQDFHAGKAGNGTRNREAFEAGCQCRDSGATEGEALAYVETGAARCGLDLHEARNAVKSAYKQPAREPITKGHSKAPLSRPASPAASAATAAATKTPAATETPGKRRVVARYDYTDANGNLLYQVERTDPKGFRQRRPDGNGGWIYNLEGVRRTLYRLPKMASAGEVLVVEGERDVETAERLGFVATCNSGGAGKWPQDHAAHFAGKRVVIIPDADKPGQEHAQAVARELHGVAESVRVLRLPEGVKDVSAYAETFSDTAELAERLSVMAEGAALWTPKPEADKPSGLLVVNAVDLLATPFPKSDDIVAGVWQTTSKASASAPAKLGKTCFTTGIFLGAATGRDVMGFHIPRARRLLYFQAEVTPHNLQTRLAKMLRAFDADPEQLRRNLLFCNDPRLKLTRRADLDAIREAIKRNSQDAPLDAIGFDPAYKYHDGDENNVQDATRLFDAVDEIIAEFGVAVWLVHHHGKGSGDGLATQAHRNRGSSAFADWPDSLLTLTPEDAEAGIVKLSFTLRNAEEPPAMAFQRNPDTLWFDPLPDHQFAGKGSKAKITDAEVAGVIGKGAVAYRQLVEKLREAFTVSDGTARATIRRATQSNAIRKNEGSGLYVSTR
ncbi:MAG: hypothetical protein PCFJNLEI_03557 [Verrucomicrobiae bacterium]|nr:hypothetical protein [Verrucomicrobiae bacterium]